jgi:acyl-CoA thioesterase-2
MREEHVQELVDLLELERLEDNLFRGQSRDIGTRYVFGGQVLGQALSAAQRTVDPRREAHSLHAYFLRAGDIEAPILNGSISFQEPEKGFEHQTSMPEVPSPEDVEPMRHLSAEELSRLPIKLQRWLGIDGPFEFRQVWPRDEMNPVKRPPIQHIWFRLTAPIGDSPVLHRALLAYASDFHLIGTATLPHGISYLTHNVQMASLDHALWFHRPFRVDEWLLYSFDSPTAQGGRGLARGQIYSRDGRLVASTAQEGLIRLRGE